MREKPDTGRRLSEFPVVGAVHGAAHPQASSRASEYPTNTRGEHGSWIQGPTQGVATLGGGSIPNAKNFSEVQNRTLHNSVGVGCWKFAVEAPSSLESVPWSEGVGTLGSDSKCVNLVEDVLKICDQSKPTFWISPLVGNCLVGLETHWRQRHKRLCFSI